MGTRSAWRWARDAVRKNAVRMPELTPALGGTFSLVTQRIQTTTQGKEDVMRDTGWS